VVTSLLTLNVLGTLMLAATIAAGYFSPHGPGWMRQHFLLALGSTFLLVMGHSFIMFFLIATGVEMKAMEKDGDWGDSFRRRIVGMKARAFPLMTGALFLAAANFILGGGAHTRALPALVHEALAWATLVVSALALRREWQVLGDNNRLISEAASRREDTPVPGRG
jgi:hypothetical protein